MVQVVVRVSAVFLRACRGGQSSSMTRRRNRRGPSRGTVATRWPSAFGSESSTPSVVQVSRGARLAGISDAGTGATETESEFVASTMETRKARSECRAAGIEIEGVCAQKGDSAGADLLFEIRVVGVAVLEEPWDGGEACEIQHHGGVTVPFRGGEPAASGEIVERKVRGSGFEPAPALHSPDQHIGGRGIAHEENGRKVCAACEDG